MFEKEYREVFSQVKASQDLTRRVMNMKMKKSQKLLSRGLARVALVAALLALMAISVSASETVQNWFVNFFTNRNGGELSQGQVEYIEENTQSVANKKTHNGWTIEMLSAIQDGRRAYAAFRLQAPAEIDLDKYVDEYRDTWGQYTFWNLGAEARDMGAQDVVSWSENVNVETWSITWLKDQDDLKNTKTLLIQLNPYMNYSEADPFGPDAVYTFRFENIVWEYEDKEYVEELKSGKYAGEADVSYTPEEARRMYKYDLLAEGVWEFTLCFGDREDDNGEYVELLTKPIEVKTNVFRSFGPEIEDYAVVEDHVTLTSIRMWHLTVQFCYESIDGTPELNLYEGEDVLWPVIVMKDGTELELRPDNSDGTQKTMVTDMPIIFEDVSYIRMPDGTVIPMPE